MPVVAGPPVVVVTLEGPAVDVETPSDELDGAPDAVEFELPKGPPALAASSLPAVLLSEHDKPASASKAMPRIMERWPRIAAE